MMSMQLKKSWMMVMVTSEVGKEQLWSIIDKIEMSAEEAGLSVIGEGSKIFDVDKLLYVCTYMWFVEHNKIIMKLDRVRELIELELIEEEEKVRDLQEVRSLFF